MKRPREPQPEEYGAFFAGYVAHVRGRDPMHLLRTQPEALWRGCAPLDEAAARFRYAPGKWSVQEVIGHISDAERVFSHWLHRIVRGDGAALQGFDEAPYVQAAEFEARSLKELVEDFAFARAATLALIAGIPPSGWARQGILRGDPMTAVAVRTILAGHAEHHFDVLRTRYEVSIPSDSA